MESLLRLDNRCKEQQLHINASNVKCLSNKEVVTERYQIFTYGFLVPFSLTYSMEQIPSGEDNWSTGSQEIPCILWNLKVHYCIYKCPPPHISLS